MNLKDFSLLKEDNDSYHVRHPQGKTLVVSKQGMAAKAHDIIKSLQKPHMSDAGGLSVDVSDKPLDVSKLNVPKVGDDLKQPSDLENATESAAALTNVTGNMIPDYAAATQPAPTAQPAQTPSSSPSAISMPDMTQFNQANQMGQAAGKDMYQSAQQQENAAASMIPNLQAQQQQAASDADMVHQQWQKNYIEEAAKADQLQQKYESMKIDPNRIINNMSTGGKITAAIGLMLGGLGAAAYGGKNPAMDVINQSIDRDIDAQKNDKEGVMNLWRMNRDQSNTDLEATIKTKQQYLGAAQAVLNANAAKTGAAQTKLNASGALNTLSQQQMTMQQQLAAMKLGQGQMTQQNLPAIVQAKARAGLITPAESEAAMKEVGTSQGAAQMRDNLLQSFDSINNMTGAGILSPADASSAKNAFSVKLEHLLAGRYNEEAAKTEINAVMPNLFSKLGGTSANRRIRLNELLDDLQYNNPHLQAMGLATPPPKRKLNGQ